ncbi:hypothetical protein [Acidithiobacillus thiooxidans]|uniref:hypothetical protein n=1 Tax=Acidithiobacillus thiooxidans TaxID=930 RepID=UPI0004E2334B|nr:hypothetical protein [Acidithiobacillus thiooxidans]
MQIGFGCFSWIGRYGPCHVRVVKKYAAVILVGVIIGCFPLLSTASVSGVLDTQKTMEQISATGFSWWQTWSRVRQSYRNSAMQCMASSAEKRPGCWSALAGEIRVTAQAALLKNTHPYACQSVVLSMHTYWLDLARLADKNVTTALRYGHPIRDSMVAQTAKDLRYAQEMLRSMADTGRCP